MRRHHRQLKPRASKLCRFPQSGARWMSHIILFLASEGMILTRSLPVRQRSAGFERQTIWGHNETSDSYSVYNVDIHHQSSSRPTAILATSLPGSSGAATHIRKSPSLHRQSPERPFLLKQCGRLTQFDDLALIHHNDQIIVDNSRYPMCDGQDCGIIEV